MNFTRDEQKDAALKGLGVILTLQHSKFWYAIFRSIKDLKDTIPKVSFILFRLHIARFENSLYLAPMKKLLPILLVFLMFQTGCLLFSNKSADPSGIFINSLSKQDGNWNIDELTVTCYVDETAYNAGIAAFDTMVYDAGAFHFDNSDDIDGEGTFTEQGGQPVSFKYYVPDFDEDMTQQPLLRFVFTGFPNMESNVDDYHKKDDYSGSGSASGMADFFPLLSSVPPATYRIFVFSYKISRIN